MLFSWYIRWLYPASSEPPPLDRLPELDWDTRPPMPQFPTWTPPWPEQPKEPIPNPDVPFVQSSWTMVFGTWFAYALYTTVEVEEVPDQFFLEQAKPMPEFPPWRPPDHPSFYEDREEAPHPEIDRIDLPIWVPWRPIPHQDFFEDRAEFVGPDKYESPHRLPVHPIPQLRFPFEPQDDEPLPLEPGWDFIQPMHLLPPQPPHFMPPHIPFHIDLGSPPEKCPPPCLRRPDKKC